MTMERESTAAPVGVRVHTALGDFELVATERGLRAVTWLRANAWATPPPPPAENAAPHARDAVEALRRYARGEPARYEGPLDVPAPDFHLAVWERVRAIPFGATATYGEIAAALGVPGEARAVGAALAANPVCILVPCHRVIGGDGSLRGFAWGLEFKRRLLAHEGGVGLPLFAAAAGPRG